MTIKTLNLVTVALLLTSNTFAEKTLQDITVVSATKTTQSLKNVTSNIDVITAQDIEERGYITVTEALNSLSGVSFTSNGGLGQATSIHLRGMDTKRTLVLIDGVRYNDITGLAGAPFTHLMASDIEQIEVVKGAQSGIWGADASAGVINIITKKAKQGVHGSIHAQKGSFNTNKYGITLSSATENYHFKVSHNVIDSHGFSAQATKGVDIDTFEDDAYTNKTTSLQLGFNINETNKIELSHTLIDAENEYDTFGNPNGDAHSKTKDTFSSINFNHIDSFNELNVYAKKSIFNREFIAPDFSGTIKTTPFDGTVKEYGFTSNIPYGKENFALVGADYKSFEQENTINKKFNNKGIFVTNSNTFDGFMGGKTILTESLRHDRYSTFDNKTTGKIGLKHIHGAVEGLTTSVNYGTSYNVPTLYQLYSAYGNKNLTPETTKSFDISITYKDFSITYFNTKIDDIINFDSSTNKYGNLSGTSTINGIEASYQKEIFSDTLLSLNYTHLLKYEDNEGNDLIRRPKETLKIAIDYYGVENLHLGINAQYIGDRKDKNFSSFPASEVKIGKYTVVNLTANYDITKEIQVYGKIENLADKTYQTVYGFASTPRAFSLGLKAQF